MKSIEQMVKEYTLAVEQGPSEAGDYCLELGDNEALALYAALAEHPRLKNKLVKPLWFNYRTQQMRKATGA